MASPQKAYRIALTNFNALEASRDRLLRPIDHGERSVLSSAECQELDWLNARQAELYPCVLAAEQPLLDWAHDFLARNPTEIVQCPELVILTIRPILPGKRDHALALALGLGAGG